LLRQDHERKPNRSGTEHPVFTDAIRSLAVAIAVVVLIHLVFWIAGHGNTAADEFDPPQSLSDTD
jgi:hypothetical protein